MSKFDPPFLIVETPFHQATMERQTGMICVEKIGMVRRFYFVEKKSIKEICCLLEISRGTDRKIMRSGATEFKYERPSTPGAQYCSSTAAMRRRKRSKKTGRSDSVFEKASICAAVDFNRALVQHSQAGSREIL